MASTGDGHETYKGHHDEPPSYNSVTPYAPSNTSPPTAPVPSTDTVKMMGVPPGLEYFSQINQLNVQEKFSASQHRWGRNYDVLNSAGQQLFQARQESQCCGPAYRVKIIDNSQREVLVLLQECTCCFAREIKVKSLGGKALGKIKLHMNAFVTHLSVMDPSNAVVLHIIGPGFRSNIFGNSSFEVKSPDERHVVGLFKYENGQMFVSFPVDLDVIVKALLLAGCFYLDALMYGARINVLTPRDNN